MLDAEPFGLAREDREAQLLDELKRDLAFHLEHCRLFADMMRGTVSDASTIESLGELPFLPAQYFKEAGELLYSVPRESIVRELRSSATSGRASTVALDKETARRQVSALTKALSSFLGAGRRRMWVCDASPVQAGPGEVSARAAAVLGFLSFASKHEYLLSVEPGGALAFERERLVRLHDEVVQEGKPITIIGFTAVAFTLLIEPLVAAGIRLELPAGSSFLHIGGWKKLEDRRVGREQFASMIDRAFGIPARGVVDSYGFTEQMGTVHAECEAGRKHAPAFADVLVRDPLSFELLPDGQIGAGQFLSVVPKSYPGFSVLTDDLVRVLGRDECTCGRKGTTFEVLGRHANAELRGCGDILAEKVIARVPTPAAGRATAQVPLVFSRGSEFYHSFGGGMPRAERLDWADVHRQLRSAQSALAAVPVDDILGLLGEAAAVWADLEGPFREFHQRGLSFVVNFIRGGGLERSLDASMRGSRAHLDEFRVDQLGPARLRAVPKGIAVHWLAGNVPTLGFLSVMLAMASKNANLIKVPREVSPLLCEMLRTLSLVEYRSPGGRVTRGTVLTDATLAVWVARGSGDAEAMSAMADARIVWGGAEAVEAVAVLPRRFDATDVIFGPKLSVAAIGRETLATPSLARRAARGIAVDGSVFDQMACASAHTVFAESGGAVSGSQFSAILGEEMARVSKRIPWDGFSGRLAGAIKSARARHFVDGEVFAPRGLEWTVLYRDREERPEPVYGRTVTVRPVGDLESVARFIDRDTQVVGLALAGPRRTRVAELLAAAGVDRISEPGMMTEFTVPWDGVFPADRLVRWVSLLR